MEQKQINETRRQLDEIREALIGYAVVNGRLPCPATTASSGAENPAGGNCSNFYNGYVPAATLGLNGPVNNAGLMLDAWGNPIRYAVSSWSRTTPPAVNNVFTTSGGMANVGITSLAPNLQVCSTATGIGASNCAAGASLTPNGTPAILYSTGKNGGYGGTGIDEVANTNNTAAFVSHAYTPSGAANGEFDDIMIWVPSNLLINRMIAAGQLP